MQFYAQQLQYWYAAKKTMALLAYNILYKEKNAVPGTYNI